MNQSKLVFAQRMQHLPLRGPLIFRTICDAWKAAPHLELLAQRLDLEGTSVHRL